MLDGVEILVLSFCSVVILASSWSLYRFAAQARYPALIRKRLTALNGNVLRALESDAVIDSFLDRIGHLILSRAKLLDACDELTTEAGYFTQSAPYRLAAIAALSGLAASSFALVGGGLLELTTWRLALLTFWGLAVGGWAPIGFAVYRKRKRLKALRSELPFCVDILIVMLRSGNSIEQCFRQVLALGPMSLPETYRTIELLVADLDNGKPYTDALDRWSKLLAIPLARTLANVFVQALLHGTEIAGSLEQLADTLVENRLQDARMAAGKRLPQLTVIMLVFLLPPMLAIIAMPAMTQLMAGLGHLK